MYHVLRRHLTPRHPLYALIRFSTCDTEMLTLSLARPASASRLFSMRYLLACIRLVRCNRSIPAALCAHLVNAPRVLSGHLTPSVAANSRLCPHTGCLPAQTKTARYTYRAANMRFPGLDIPLSLCASRLVHSCQAQSTLLPWVCFSLVQSIVSNHQWTVNPHFVEMRGLEPLTYALQRRRSPG